MLELYFFIYGGSMSKREMLFFLKKIVGVAKSNLLCSFGLVSRSLTALMFQEKGATVTS
jgi:hypothetical protein